MLANLLVDEKDQEEIRRLIGRMETMGDVTDGYPESYAWMLAANTLAENERLDEALECCRRSASMLIDAIESDPFREPLLSSLLDVYTKYEAILCVLEKTDEGLAERMLEVFPATDGEPNSIRCLALMFNGMHYLFRGEMEDAAGNLSECIRLADSYIGINPTVDATLFCALLALFHINKDGKLVDRAEDIAERLACSSERSEDSNMMAIHEFAYATMNEMGVSRTRSVGETLGYSVREGGCVEPASPMLMWIVSTSVVE